MLPPGWPIVTPGSSVLLAPPAVRTGVVPRGRPPRASSAAGSGASGRGAGPSALLGLDNLSRGKGHVASVDGSLGGLVAAVVNESRGLLFERFDLN